MRLTYRTPVGWRRQMGRFGRPLEADQVAWRNGELVIYSEMTSSRQPIRITFSAADLPILAAALEGAQQ